MSTTNFRISYEWLTGDYADPALDATVAALGISVGPWSATEVEDALAQTVRLSVRVSALRLAEWFVANWWRLLWEPQSGSYSWRASHRMGNVGHGYVWPDLTFNTDWESIRVECRPTPRREIEPIRYLNHFDHYVSVADFEAGIEKFVNGTIARLAHFQDTPSTLSLLWDEVSAERTDPESSDMRILEACMGYDPDEAPVDLLENLRDEMADFGRSAIKEMAVAYRQYAISHLKDLWSSARQNGVLVHVPEYDDIHACIKDESNSLVIPWKRAERVAHIVRAAWDVSPPVSTEQLCDLMHISHVDYLGTQTDGWRTFMAGFRDDDTCDNFRMTLHSRYSTSRRFSLLRLVADHITAEDSDRLLPGTGSLTSRQKFQRAFAQEFLCPFDALEDYLGSTIPDSDEIHDAAQYFEVSPLMIHTILVNKGILGRETLEN